MEMRSMKVGFCTINYSELPLPEVVELVARKGYEAVEIRRTPATVKWTSMRCCKEVMPGS
jgi:sugar phosphate isomerase/epimerase